LEKIISNLEKLPVTLENHVTISKTWVDRLNIFKYYYYMDTITNVEKQLNPKRTILEYNGSSKKKNVPNDDMHQDMIDSSKDIELTIKTVNQDFTGWHEQYHIMLHNWPHSRKPQLDPETGTLKYNFGDDLYNQHATGSKGQGFVSYEEMASYIQLEKLKQKIIDHENPDTPKVYEDSLKPLEWYQNAFSVSKPYPEGNYIQGRDQIASVTSHISGLKDDFNLNPDPQFWRENGFQYYIIKDGKQIIVGGNSRGRGFVISAMRNKGMYSIEIPEEDIDVLTLEDLEFFSAWLNKRTSLRQKFTNRDTLELRLYNKIVKGNYLTKKTKDAGRVPQWNHPVLLSAFDGYENQFSKTDIASMKSSITKKFEKERQKEVRREEGSIDTSDQGLKIKANKDVWDKKTSDKIKSLEKNIGRTLKLHHEIKSMHGFIGKTVTDYLCGLETDILKNKMDETEFPHDLVVFVSFLTGAKFDRFVKGLGSGDPDKLKAIEKRAGRMIDGTLSIIPIDPRVESE
jgi:hypothetical protein